MEKKPFTGRLTSKRLIVLINEMFDRYEITQYRCTRVVTTKYTSDQYEGGACKMHIYFNDTELIGTDKETENEGHILGYNFLKEIEILLKTGYELSLYTNHRFSTSMGLLNCELEVRKVK